jgi:hypothetical protein
MATTAAIAIAWKLTRIDWLEGNAGDYSLSPSHALSKQANKKHKDFQSKIYPAFGKTHQDGDWGFCSSATDVGDRMY